MRDGMPAPDERRQARLTRRTLGVAGAVAATVAFGGASRAAGASAVNTAASDTSEIQDRIDALAANGGGVLKLAAGTYLLDTPLELRSNITLRGAGAARTILREGSALGAAPIVKIVGTEDAPVTDVALEGLTVRNGTAGTGSVALGQDGVVIDYSERVRVADCIVTETAGYYGVRCDRSTGVSITGSKFLRCAYAMVMLMPECDTVTVSRCMFDTVVSTAYANVYMFATGGETLNSGKFAVRNVTVEDSTFVNNPLWIGINTHGGDNVVIRRNRVRNTKYGILCALTQKFVPDAHLTNVRIEDNVVTKPAANNVSGIAVDNVSALDQALDVVVTGNVVDGYGGTYATYGAITLGGITDARIARNTVRNYGQYGVCLKGRMFEAEVKRNSFEDLAAVGANGAGRTAAIGSLTAGMFGIRVHDNRSTATDTTTTPDWFVYAPATAGQSWQIVDNPDVVATQAPVFANAAYLPVLKDALPTQHLTQRYQDVVLGSDGKPKWSVTQPPAAYGSLDFTSTLVTAAADAGSPVLTSVSAASGSADWLPPHTQIHVAGAGADGGVLVATVVENTGSGKSVTLDRPVITAVTAADVTYAPLTLTAVASRS